MGVEGGNVGCSFIEQVEHKNNVRITVENISVEKKGYMVYNIGKYIGCDCKLWSILLLRPFKQIYGVY